jgi:hypothetical protein
MNHGAFLIGLLETVFINFQNSHTVSSRVRELIDYNTINFKELSLVRVRPLIIIP